MIEYISEHDYYMNIEDDIYNQNESAVLVFTDDSDLSKELISRLETLSNSTTVPIYIVTEGSIPNLEMELSIGKLNCRPTVVIYDDGNKHLFDGDQDMRYIIEQIQEM